MTRHPIKSISQPAFPEPGKSSRKTVPTNSSMRRIVCTDFFPVSADHEYSRKGPFAGYYLQISPNGRSLLAGGKWSPDKNDLATIRTNILRTSKPLRKVISAPRFVKMFGPAKVDGNGKGERCNIFGADDMLKVAPKMNNVDKTHKDIDLLKLRTIGVVY